MSSNIVFNRPYLTGKETEYIVDAQKRGTLAGDGHYSQQCQNWFQSQFGCYKTLLTHSCTAALELAALLLDIQAGDEIIMPSYTFVSSANAFVLRGGVPVFVDIRSDTLNIDEKLIEPAINERTRAIVVVHYAGVAAEMDAIIDLANRRNIYVIEDAAQGVMASYKDMALGTIGDLGAYSFHETKNIISGEGGALLINDASFSNRAEVIREKGTDRKQFFRGEVDKYTWQEVGSSFIPSELVAAFLWAQLEEANNLTNRRIGIWNRYHELLRPAEEKGLLKRPYVPNYCQHNAHIYHVLLPDHIDRNKVIRSLGLKGISAVFHYVPLHSSPGGLRYGRTYGSFPVTDRVSKNLLRLPLWIGLTESQQRYVVEELITAVSYMKKC